MADTLNNIVTPVPDRLKGLFASKQPRLFGNCVDYPASDFVNEDLRKYAIAIIGIGYNDAELYLNNVRESFYSLYLHKEYLKIIDLGNILVGREDTGAAEKIELALQTIVKYNVFVIPFGKSPVYLNNCYNALKSIDNAISVSCIAPSATIGSAADNLSRQNHLAHLLEDRNTALFNLNIIGYQQYLSDPDSLELLNKYYCQTMRLGVLRSDFKMVEPLLRDTDILGFNISAVRQSDAPASLDHSPNGLYAEEICQLARYGGISDRLKVAGIFGFNLERDVDKVTSQLVAQVMWHLIDGYIARRGDNPLKNVNEIKKYIVDMGSPMRQLVFYYSNLSERWWMEVLAESSASNLLVACSYDDYRAACNHEVPLRWVWFHQKMSQKNNAD